MALLKVWSDNSPVRKKEAEDAKVATNKWDIASGNSDAVSLRVDSLISTASSNSPGEQGSISKEGIDSTLRRLSSITGSS